MSFFGQLDFARRNLTRYRLNRDIEVLESVCLSSHALVVVPETLLAFVA